MTCQRCGAEGSANTNWQVDHLAVVQNGISRIREVQLCRTCRAGLWAAWDAATAPLDGRER